MEGRFNMGNRFKNIEEVIENECFWLGIISLETKIHLLGRH